VDNNYSDLGTNKSGFVHTLPSGRLNFKRKRWYNVTISVFKATPRD
jgi:hypothetical protein